MSRWPRLPHVAFIALALILFLQGCASNPKAPAYHWYTVRAEFEVDGEIVSLGGTVECERESYLSSVLSPSGRVHYIHSTHIFAKRLVDGSALIITPKSACRTPDHSILSDFPEDYRPAIFWLDDAERPTHMEFIFSDAYFQRPDARVQFKGFFAERLEAPGIFWPIYWHSENEREVPWLARKDPHAFHGYHVTVADESQWRQIPGLSDYLEPLSEITSLDWYFPAFSDESRRRNVGKLMSPGIHGPHSGGRYYECRTPDGPTKPGCEGIARTYGMIPNKDRQGASFSSLDRTIGSILLLSEKKELLRPPRQFSLDGAVVGETPVYQFPLNTFYYNPHLHRLYWVEWKTIRLENRRLVSNTIIQ